MAQAQPLQSQFSAGELSPRMAARVDFSRYPAGAELFENLIPLPQGGAMRRSGTRFVAEVKDSAAHTHLGPFEFSTEQAYVIERGNLYFRFYTLQGRLTAPDQGDSAVTNGTFDSDISGWTNRSAGTATISHNSSGNYLELNGDGGSNTAVAEQHIGSGNVDTLHIVKFRVRGLPAGINNHVLLRIGTAQGARDIIDDRVCEVGYHTVEFTPTGESFHLQFRVVENRTIGVDNVEIIAGLAPVELETPYTTAQVHDVNGPQSADVLYLFHGSHPTHKLERRGTNSWSLIEVRWVDGPWLDANAESTFTLQPSATSGPGVTVTASGFSPFVASDVGRLIRISNPASGTSFGYAVITAVGAGHQCTVQVEINWSTTNATSNWQLGAWSSSRGYPKTGAFHEQRLVAANTTKQPQTVFLSQSADFENMTPDNRTGTVEDDDALNLTISADQVQAIQWMVSLEDLVIGTSSGEWTLGSDGPFIKPTDIEIKRRTTHGSDAIQPARNGPFVLFVQRAKRKIRQFAFDELIGFRAIDLTRLSDHITRSKVHEIAFAQEPHLQLLVVREDGEMAVLTHSPEEEVIGWGRYILGGSFGTGKAVVESIAVIPGNSTTDSDQRNEVWVVVKRTIGGVTKRYVEFFEFDFETGDTQADAFYVDSGLTYEGSAITTISGLTHLVGETVAVFADGAVHPNVVVAADGTVTLQQSVAVAQIGLPYTHRLKTLKLEAGATAGVALGKTKRLHFLTLVVLNALTFRAGRDWDNLKSFDFRKVEDPMDTAPPLFTGEKQIEFDGDWDSDTRIVIRSSDPCPFTLLALAPEGYTYDVK